MNRTMISMVMGICIILAMSICPYRAFSADESIVVTESGNVGIGTTTPQAKFDVNGKVKHDGVEEINWSGTVAGNATILATFTHASASVFEVTAMFNHYGYIRSHGCARKSLVGHCYYLSNGTPQGGLDIIDITNINSANGGSWTIERTGNTNELRITKTAGTYQGAGYYSITVRGAAGLTKK